MKKTITFIISVEVEDDNKSRLKKLIRTARTIIKNSINNTDGMKAIRIKNEGI